MVDHSGKPIQNQHPMQHMTFEESLGESGYSTPNSRSRRIIREIIVWKWNAAASDFLMDKTTHSHLLKEFYFKNSDDDVKKIAIFNLKNVEKSVITLFSSLTLKKIKTIFLTNHMSKHKTTGGWPEACRQVRISLNIVLDQEKQKYKINTYCVQLYSFWWSVIWAFESLAVFEYYFLSTTSSEKKYL